MAVYLPPIARKKKVIERYNPDTFRVIGEDAESSHPKFESSPYRASFEPPTPEESLFPHIDCRRTRVLPRPTADFRANKPQPTSCSFILTDVRLLNEPVCTVYTRETQPTQHLWWPSRANKGTLEKGEYTCDTVYRSDYLYTKDLAPQPSYRYSANPNTEASTGIAPVNFLREENGEQRFFEEHKSFEHQYNSRADPNYPIRGKRHGSFVYTRVDPETAKKFSDYYNNLDQELLMDDCQEDLPVVIETHSTSALAPVEDQPKNSSQEVTGTKMMPTASSPIEWYDPEEPEYSKPVSAFFALKRKAPLATNE